MNSNIIMIPIYTLKVFSHRTDSYNYMNKRLNFHCASDRQVPLYTVGWNIVLSILMHITQLIPHSVSVPLSNTRVYQQSNHSDNYVREVVVKATADVVNCIKWNSYCKGCD